MQMYQKKLVVKVNTKYNVIPDGWTKIKQSSSKCKIGQVQFWFTTLNHPLLYCFELSIFSLISVKINDWHKNQLKTYKTFFSRNIVGYNMKLVNQANSMNWLDWWWWILYETFYSISSDMDITLERFRYLK